ncbi:hypothetical protein EVAR_5114_1 [Eumeta japonica]|uniref:Uncharacterized protein n=1 Tax=Eumeta variegata TaxID=151549 RepID=A0A4C1SUF4_EUMVA|nr:hypothetical protein EVAR_5114_1 [Eumeta japonica]
MQIPLANDIQNKAMGPARTEASIAIPNAIYAIMFGSREAKQKRGFFYIELSLVVKWMHYDNPKRRKSWGLPDHASTSTAKPNIHKKNLVACKVGIRAKVLRDNDFEW